MKIKRLILSCTTLAALVAATVVFVPTTFADAKADAAAARKAKKEKETLAKYDKNLDGVLDASEKAMLKADDDEAKAARKAATAENKKKKEEAKLAMPR